MIVTWATSQRSDQLPEAWQRACASLAGKTDIDIVGRPVENVRMREEAIKAVCEAVDEVLQRGLPQEREVLEFVAGTHGEATPTLLAALLAERDSADAAVVAELLLFPGEDVRIGLEPVLERARLDMDEAAAVAERLSGTAHRTEAVLPNGAAVAFALEPEEMRRFVDRLRLDHSCPEEIAAVIADRFPGLLGLRLKAMLRHGRQPWSLSVTSFLLALFGRMKPAEPLLLEAVDWVLAFLAVPGTAEDPIAALGRRYRELTVLLRRADGLQAALQAGNYETLVMQGGRVPNLHPESLRQEMALVDLAARAAAGQPASALAGVVDMDLGAYDDAAELLQALNGRGDP